MAIKDARARAKERGLIRKQESQAAAENPDDEEIIIEDDQQVPASTLLTDADPLVARRLLEYGDLVGLPDDWAKVRILEQVRAEIIKTSQNALDLQRARGRLVERKELDTMAARIRDTWWREVQQISSMALAELSEMPIEARSKIKQVIDSQVQLAASRVKADLTS